jgi:hypothetical protein
MGIILVEWDDFIQARRGFTCVDAADPAAGSGTVREWRVFVSGPETLKREALRDDGAGQYALVGESVLESAVAGMNTFECSIPGIEAGGIIGFYVEGKDFATVKSSSTVARLRRIHLGDVYGPDDILMWAPASGISGQFSIYAIGCGIAPQSVDGCDPKLRDAVLPVGRDSPSRLTRRVSRLSGRVAGGEGSSPIGNGYTGKLLSAALIINRQTRLISTMSSPTYRTPRASIRSAPGTSAAS